MSNLVFVATCDLAGKVRGKAFPVDDLDRRLVRGVGWTPTNVQINCFDGIAESPFGSLGDLLLVPDATTRVRAEFGPKVEDLFLGDILTLEGTPWEFCTRSLLKSALKRLKTVADVTLLAAFEQEFQVRGKPTIVGDAFGRTGFEAERPLCEEITGQIAAAGFTPDSIMKEYGPNQYEVVVGPEKGVRAADAAVMVRELARSSGRHVGTEVTFAPILDPESVGNGVHIHMSFLDSNDNPVTYDAGRPGGMSRLTEAFAGGVLKYLDSILAITAPSVISYLRLTPHRWSAAFNNLGFRDREASLRICPVTSKDPAAIERQFNLEFRAADAAACPHLALAAIVHAGVQGIEEGLESPITEDDLSLLSSETLAARNLIRLPESLEQALQRMDANECVKSWFPETFLPVYLAHKASEIAHLANMTDLERCSAYSGTY